MEIINSLVPSFAQAGFHMGLHGHKLKSSLQCTFMEQQEGS